MDFTSTYSYKDNDIKITCSPQNRSINLQRQQNTTNWPFGSRFIVYKHTGNFTLRKELSLRIIVIEIVYNLMTSVHKQQLALLLSVISEYFMLLALILPVDEDQLIWL